ncbi:MAG TPA: GNAT family N-acetyltransferase, partial [Candidatus Hydrogenedentes bacterium]|nr:GNAT family N-acetyltransferase [Candidatus Hydrogenedentota bacterium]
VSNDEVLSAAFRRSGVLRVNDVESLFAMAEVLGKQPRPAGPRLAILSNAAGPGILATDALIEAGGELATLSDETIAALDALLPDYWNRRNPIDLVGDADPERYARAIEVVARDENADGVLVVLTPQVWTDATGTAEAVVALEGLPNKPIVASWMGGDTVAEGEDILNAHNIPVFQYPDMSARVFNAMWRYSYNLRGIFETPVLHPDSMAEAFKRPRAEAIIKDALAQGRTLLTPPEAKALLEAYGIVLIETHVASDAEEAIRHARRIGYPVVLQRLHPGGAEADEPSEVVLNVPSDAAVREAYAALRRFHEKNLPHEPFHGVLVQPDVPKDGYEAAIGSNTDPRFGPYLSVGAGGQTGRVWRDCALAIPPLNSVLARRMIEQTRLYSLLKSNEEGAGVNLAGLEQLMVRFSYLVVEQRRIREITIDPMMISRERLAAFEARVVLHEPEVCLEALPKLAIRPYPNEYVCECTMRDGRPVTVRPIRPEDEELMVRFHESLSNDTVYFRFLRLLSRDQLVKHERLSRLCFIDYDRSMALLALDKTVDPGAEQRLLGVARFVKLYGTDDADFAIMIRDDVQGQGLGKTLMQRLIEVARAEHVRRLVGTILSENRPMLRMCAGLGFKLHKPVGDDTIAELIL